MAQTVMPSERVSDFKRVIVSFAVNESRPDVGSSKNRTRGLETIDIAIEVRFACPPEIPLHRDG